MSYKKTLKKQQKEKQRQKADKKKLEQARLADRAEKKADLASEKANRRRIKPYRNPQIMGTFDRETLRKLEKNMKLLKNLENEFMEQLKHRQDLNEELEAKGYVTMEEKMNYLKDESQKVLEAARARATTPEEKAMLGITDSTDVIEEVSNV